MLIRGVRPGEMPSFSITRRGWDALGVGSRREHTACGSTRQMNYGVPELKGTGIMAAPLAARKQVKQKVKPTRVLCRGPFALSDGGYFRVLVEPREVVGRPITFTMSGSCFWHSYPPHKLAWAVGYRVLNMVSDAGFRPPAGESSTPLEIGGFTTGPSSMPATQQVDYAIRDAPLSTKARQVIVCPTCSSVLPVSDWLLEMDSECLIGDGQPVPVECHCGRSLARRSDDLALSVEWTESPLERELRNLQS